MFGQKIASTLKPLLPNTPFVTHSDTVDAVKLFGDWKWDDRWDDADMATLIHYLYGDKLLAIPQIWRGVLPKKW